MSLLILNDLHSRLPTWEFTDLGFSTNNPVAGFYIDTVKEHVYTAPICQVGRGRHGFRAIITYVRGVILTNNTPSWEMAYVERPHFSVLLQYAPNPDHLKWPIDSLTPSSISPNYKPLNNVVTVCSRMLALMEDPVCQTILSEKICTAMTTFATTGMKLPDH